MATVITHALAAGLLSSAAPPGVSKVRLAVVLGALAMLPDLDVVGFRLGIAYGDMLGHRGFTHSILFAAMAGAITPSLAFSTVRIFSGTWCSIAALAFTATLSHGILDAFTDAGLGVGFFIPFDDTRYFAPWRPIATSPVSIRAFVDGPAIRILTNELVWIGIPLASAVGLVSVIRRTGRRVRANDVRPRGSKTPT